MTRSMERTSVGGTSVAAQAGRWAVAVLATAVALYSLRFWVVLGDDIWWDVDPGIRHVIEVVPVQSLLHMLVAPIALLVGSIQFFPEIRSRHPSFHRWLGRLYVCTCVVAGAGALATSPFASGGSVAAVGFGMLAVAWIATTIVGWLMARRRRFDVHRVAMRFSYAMAFAAVTLRLQIPIGFALGYESYSSMSPLLAYTCWIPNVVLVAVYSVLERHRRKRLISAAGT